MTVSDLKTFIYNLTYDYFKGATVVWGGLPNSVKPTLPFVVLQTGDIIRQRDGIMTDDFTRYIPARITVDINLYTKGKVENFGRVYPSGKHEYFTWQKNTATEDLSDFVNYLISPYCQDKFREQNIGLSIEAGLRDLTQVLDNEFEFRAMQEIVLTYFETSAGYAGISRDNWAQTPSGGGSAALAAQVDNEIDEVEFDQVDFDAEPDDGDGDDNDNADDGGDNENEGE